MVKYKKSGLGKRILAVTMAVLTAIGTASINIEALAAEYGGYGGSGGNYIASDGSLGEIFTNVESGNQEVKSVSVKIAVEANKTYVITSNVYENMTDISDPTSGVQKATTLQTYSQPTEEAVEINLPINSTTDLKPLVLTPGETVGVAVNIRCLDDSNIYYYEGATTTSSDYAFRKDTGSSPWSTRSNDVMKIVTSDYSGTPSDITGVTLDIPSKVVTLGDEDQTASVGLSPNYLRTPSVTSDGNAVSVIGSNTLHAAESGEATITASYGDATPATVKMYVLDNTLEYTTHEYTGSPIEPTVNIVCGSKSLVQGTDYDLRYSTDHTNVGTASVTVDGRGDYLGYSKTYEYTITQGHITQDMVNAGTYNIDTTTDSITSSSISSATRTLVPGTDYDVSCEFKSGTASALTYTVTVTGKGNYVADTFTKDVTVSPSPSGKMDINGLIVASLTSSSYDYTGSAIMPTYTLKDRDGNTISEEFKTNNLDILTSNNTNVTTTDDRAELTIKGKGDYTGVITLEFDIDPVDLESDEISVTLDKTIWEHTGSAITPTPSVVFTPEGGSQMALRAGTDYQLSYRNNKDIGTGKVVISSDSGNFEGELEVDFDIIADFVKDTTVTIGGYDTNYNSGFVSAYTVGYTGNANEPEIKVKAGSKRLKVNTDYTYTYENNTDAGTATVHIVGKGKYVDRSIDATFTITPIKITSSLTMYQLPHTYTGSAIELASSEYVLKQGTRTLVQGTDYDVTFSNNINAGQSTAVATATGKGNYSGTAVGYYTIDPKDLSDSDITVDAIADRPYTGAAQTPAPVVRDKGTTITNSNYTVQYENNTNVSTSGQKAKVIITGKGNYAGETSQTFSITSLNLRDLNIYVGGELAEGTGAARYSAYETEYTGAETKPAIVVKDKNGKTIGDWASAPINNIEVGSNAGSYIWGTGAYEGSYVTVYYTITERDISSSGITYTQSGTKKDARGDTIPVVSVNDSTMPLDKRTLVEGTDYEVVPAESPTTSGADKIAYIKGIGNYKGQIEVTYEIGNNLASGTNVQLLEPSTARTPYTKSGDGKYYITFLGKDSSGKGYDPVIEAEYQGTPLVEGTDYTLDYGFTSTDRWNANNTVTVTINGKGDYYGSVSETYVIQQKPITNVDTDPSMTLIDGNTDASKTADWTYTYNGKVKSVTPKLTYAPTDTISNSLVLGTDYTIDRADIGPDVYRSSKDGPIITMPVTITASGNYIGSKTVNYIINPYNVEDSEIQISTIADQPYTGSAVTPDVTVTRKFSDGSTKILERGVEYTLDYKDNIAVGNNTAMVLVTGKGNYTGLNDTRTFSIVRNDLGDGNTTITDIDTAIYTGAAVEPGFTAYYKDKPLVLGTDYTVEYKNNTDIGIGTAGSPNGPKIILTGMGAYMGTYTGVFSIKGDIASDTFKMDPLADSYQITSSGGITLSKSNIIFRYNNPSGIETMLSSDNYELELPSTIAPGTATIRINGQNKMFGTKSTNIKLVGNLADATIYGVGTDYDYTGNQITPPISVSYGGRTLTQGVDYKVVYGENKTAGTGTGTVTIEALPNSNYTGTKSQNFNIRYNLNNAQITGFQSSYPYTGEAITPGDIQVKIGDTTLNKGSDYTVTYGNNINVLDGGTIIITANSGYTTGTKTATFSITPITIDSSNSTILYDGVSPAGTYDYTGAAQQPVITVTYQATRDLQINKDFTVTYIDNFKAGNAKVRVVGTGNYRGAIDGGFTITPVDIGNVTINVPDAGYAGGEPVYPKYSITYNGYTMLAGEDYEVSFYDNKNVGTGTVTFKGLGNFSGTVQKTFNITQTDLRNGEIVIDSNRSTYTGNEVTPRITVKCPTGASEASKAYYTLKEGTDYDITYSDTLVDVGTYTITVTGKGNFINSLDTQYVIEEKPLDSADIQISDIDDQAYTGTAIEPAIIVTDSTRGVELVAGTDYDIEYLNNTAAGSATGTNPPTVRLTGKGNYGGVVDKTFNIGTDLSNSEVTLDTYTYIYNGQECKPAVTVKKADGTILVEGTDYTVAYKSADGSDDVTNAGAKGELNKKVIISGAEGYYGAKEVGYTVNPKPADPDKILLETTLQKDEEGRYITTYDGLPALPNILVYDTEISDTATLRAGTDYKVEYLNNTDVSTDGSPAVANVIFLAGGNYDIGTDSYFLNFYILPRSITDSFEIELIGTTRQPYTGSEVTPGVNVRSIDPSMYGRQMIEGTDYTVEYTNNVNAGEATVTVTGIGDFSGSKTIDFVVVADMADAVASIPDQFYTGERIEPEFEITCGGNTLVKDVDYEVVYNSDDNWQTSGYATVRTKVPQYSTTAKNITFNIVFDPSLLVVEGYANEYTYTGEPIHPDFKVMTPSGTEIRYNPDDIVYTNEAGETGDAACTNIGTVYADIPLNIAGQAPCTVHAQYDIIGRNINNCDIVPLYDNVYRAEPLYPPVIIRNKATHELLIEGEDYTLEYSNNVDPGVGNILVTGINNYTQQTTLHFNIVAPQVINLAGTAINESSVNLSWSRNAHVTGYEIYSADSSVKYGSTSERNFTISGLQQATDYTFKVRSYIVVDGKKTEGDFKIVTVHTGIAAPDVSGTSYAKGRVTLNWGIESGISGYEIYRSSTINGTYSKIAVMPQSAGGYTDSMLVSGGTYYYKVRGYEKVGENEFVYGYFSDPIAVKTK